MKGTTTGSDIYRATRNLFAVFGLSWKNCVQICTDGAPAMIGCLKGFCTLVKNRFPHIISSHCIIHREVLMTKSLIQPLQFVMDSVIEMVNSIKAYPKQSRLLRMICDNNESHYKCLLWYSTVRWLSIGQVLKRFFVLMSEVKQHFKNCNQVNFIELLESEDFIIKLAYLVDIFEHLNTLNLSLQGPNLTVISGNEKLRAFSDKLNLWAERVERDDFAPFPTLNELKKGQYIATDIKEHLKRLRIKMKHYFPRLDNQNQNWIAEPFLLNVPRNVSIEICNEQVELRNDVVMKTKFSVLDTTPFWFEVKKKYPQLADLAFQTLVQFCSTYKCEQGFSVMNNIKNEQRTRLNNLDDELRVALSVTRPKLVKLALNLQSQPSH